MPTFLISKYYPARKIVFISLAGMAIALFSCNSVIGSHGTVAVADSQVAAIAPAYDGSLVKGRVTDTVICRNDSTQGFALYLPAGYTQEKPFPCIYFFDAHARGAMPVSAYKSIAEKYGFVLVGSNISKNGIPWPATNEAAKVLMRDTRTLRAFPVVPA